MKHTKIDRTAMETVKRDRAHQTRRKDARRDTEAILSEANDDENLRSIVIEIVFDTENSDNAYLAAKGACMALERWEAIEEVKVLKGVAD